MAEDNYEMMLESTQSLDPSNVVIADTNDPSSGVGDDGDADGSGEGTAEGFGMGEWGLVAASTTLLAVVMTMQLGGETT